MNATELAEILGRDYSQQLLQSAIARVAYTGLDGAPRVIPIGFLWTDGTIKLYTVPNSPKVKALQADPRVAITIDTAGMPPRVLLIRGAATLETVDGVPDGYIEASRIGIPPEMMADWEAGVRALYERMTVITVTPDWAKLLDFETTIPQAVAELVAQQAGPAGTP
jgi:hypothetical protein